MVASSESNTLLVFEGTDLTEPKEVQNHEMGVLDATFSNTVRIC